MNGANLLACRASNQARQFTLTNGTRDSTAALTHLGIFAKKFAEPFQGMVERKCSFVFGYPTAELKEALDG